MTVLNPVIDPTHSYRSGAVPATALGLGLVVAYLALATLPGQSDKDWVHLWLGGRMVVEGHFANLYDVARQESIMATAFPDGVPDDLWPARNQRLGGFFYPPPTALAYAAFAWLPLRAAATVAAVTTVALAMLCAALIGRITRGRVSWGVGVCALLLYPPFFYNFALGQNALWTLAVLLVVWWLADRGHDGWAGLVLGLLVCKPNWLAAVIWIPVVHRRWRMVTAAGGGALAVLGLGVALAGPEALWRYVAVFHEVMSLPQESGYVLRLKVSALGLWRKWCGPGGIGDVLGWACGVAGVCGVIWTTRGGWRPGTPRFALTMAASLLAATWFNPHVNNYDLVVVAVVALVAWWACPPPGSRLRVATAVGVVCCYVAPPLDNSWSHWRQVPLPALALAGLLAVVVWRLGSRTGVCLETRQPEGSE